MSDKLVEWAEQASGIKSPVATNLTNLLQALSQLSDFDLLALELPTYDDTPSEFR